MQDTRSEKAVIGARLRDARERMGITKEEAAEAAGAQLAAVRAWERGSALPTLPQLKGLLPHYGVSCYELLFGVTPIALDGDDLAQLRTAALALSPRLQVKLELMLMLTARASVDQVATRQ